MITSFFKSPRKSSFAKCRYRRHQFNLVLVSRPFTSPCRSYSSGQKKSSIDELTKGKAQNASYPQDFLPILDALDRKESVENLFWEVKYSPKLLSVFADKKKLRDIVEKVAQSSSPHLCLHVLNLAHHVGHTLNHSAYECASFHLAKLQYWKILLAVVTSATLHIGYASTRLLNWRALALMETGNYGALENILEEFEMANLLPSQRTFHIVLEGLLRNHDLEGAKRCLQKMTDSKVSVNEKTHALLGSFHRVFGADIQVRQNALRSLPKLHYAERITVVNNLIQSSLDINAASITLQLLSLFKDEATESILSLVSPFLDLEKEMHSSLELPNLRDDGLNPNADTVAFFMNYLMKKSEFVGAIRIANIAAVMKMPATPNLIASLVHVYFLLGQGNTAIRMIATMSVKSTGKLFDSLQIGPSLADNPPLLALTFGTLTTRICNALLKGLLGRQGLVIVPSVFTIMHANGLQPNARTVEILVSYLSKMGFFSTRSLFQILRRLLSKRVRPSLGHMHILVSCVLREEKKLSLDSAWKRYPKPMPADNPPKRTRFLHTEDSFGPLAGLAFGTRLSYRGLSRPMINSLKSRRVKPDAATIFQRIRRDAVLHLNTDSASAVLRTLLARGMQPNVYHFGALMEGYALSGNFSAAIELMSMAERAGVKPSVVMYTVLISSYARLRKPKNALQIFRQMISAGIYPDVISVDAVVSAFHSVGDYENARNLLINLWTYIEPFPDTLLNVDMDTLISHFRSLTTRTKFPVSARYSPWNVLKRLIRSYQKYFGNFKHKNKSR